MLRERLARNGPAMLLNKNTPEDKTSSTVIANSGGLWESWQEGNAKVSTSVNQNLPTFISSIGNINVY